MYNLLEQNLIDHDRDIFSVRFRNIEDNSAVDMNTWIPGVKIDLSRYPDEITTITEQMSDSHPTHWDFAEHPAWYTAVTVVAETKVNEYSLISEKTIKAILNECCWISYSAQSNLDVLTDLGFDITTFGRHATGHDIDPIIKACRELDTESVAMDYYHSRQTVIQHNKQWFEHNQWLDLYMQKLNSIL